MRETLRLLGINSDKIIESQNNYNLIETDTLIIPSFVSRSCYTPKWVVDYLRKKLLPHIESISGPTHSPHKIFISRKKASHRKVINEDEIFNILEPLGFKRYFLEDLALLEQISLFKNATDIVAPHGAGLVNLIFANAGTRVIELFQEHEDDTYWYLSQVVGLKHFCVKTTEFKKGGGYTDTVIPLSFIKDLIKRKIIN